MKYHTDYAIGDMFIYIPQCSKDSGILEYNIILSVAVEKMYYIALYFCSTVYRGRENGFRKSCVEEGQFPTKYWLRIAADL